MREIHLKDEDDLKWLLEVHLKDGLDIVKYAVLHGNEDCPETIEIFAQDDPAYYDTPIITLVLSDNGYTIS